jgi:Ala-tRNA(Pro) deacylase
MTVSKLKAFLDEQGVPYTSIAHSPAYTSQKTAATAHVPGKELAKSVVIRVDGALALAVLPATAQVDFPKLRAVLGTEKVELVPEADFRDRFSDCEVGAMPPFGNLYDVPVYVAANLAEDEEIAFNACSHTELIRLAYADFERLVQPTVLDFAHPVR